MMGTIGIHELIMILLMLSVPIVALATIILVIVLTKRAQHRKLTPPGNPDG